jgi:copper(I)-binding protein
MQGLLLRGLRGLCGLGLALAALPASLPALAHGFQKGEMNVRHPWTRATLPGASVAAGYLEIRNSGREPDRLLGASTPLAERVELHVVAREGNIVRMQEVERLEVPARERLVLRPRASHLMLVNIRRAFVAGERIPLTLRFERAGEVEVQLEVQPPGSTKPHH